MDYGRYVRLAATYSDHGDDDERTPLVVALEDPGFNALLIASNHALATIAALVGADPEPRLASAAVQTEAFEPVL